MSEPKPPPSRTDPKPPLLPPGSAPKLLRALADGSAALLWFALALLCGSDSTALFGTEGSVNDLFAYLALAAALTTGVAFGLRMASVALERVPAWVPRVEAWTWVVLSLWFVLAVVAVRV